MTIDSGLEPKKLEGAALADSLRKKLGAVALAGALVPLAVAGSSTEADAGTPPPDLRSSHVEGFVSPEGPEFRYSFEVFNTTPFPSGSGSGGGSGFGENIIVDWELPLFSLRGIDIESITSPEFWSFEIIRPDGRIVVGDRDDDEDGFSDIYGGGIFGDEGPYGEYFWDWEAINDPVFAQNPDVYGPNPDQFEDPNLILHWYAEEFFFGIFEQESLGEPFDPELGFPHTFSFLAEDGATNVPYEASWFFQEQTIGDPPSPQGQGGIPIGIPNNRVPEPGMIALFATGLLGLFGLRRRRKSI